MTCLVFGASGQVATELARQAEVTALGREAADLADPEAAETGIAQADRTRSGTEIACTRRPRLLE